MEMQIYSREAGVHVRSRIHLSIYSISYNSPEVARDFPGASALVHGSCFILARGPDPTKPRRLR